MAEWLGYKVAAHPAVVAEWLALQFSKTSILLGPRFETCSGLHDAINSAHNGGTKCSVFFLKDTLASLLSTINFKLDQILGTKQYFGSYGFCFFGPMVIFIYFFGYLVFYLFSSLDSV